MSNDFSTMVTRNKNKKCGRKYRYQKEKELNPIDYGGYKLNKKGKNRNVY